MDHGVATQDQVEWFLDLIRHQVVLLFKNIKYNSINLESPEVSVLLLVMLNVGSR